MIGTSEESEAREAVRRQDRGGIERSRSGKRSKRQAVVLKIVPVTETCS
jgi:hypothetical protein